MELVGSEYSIELLQLTPFIVLRTKHSLSLQPIAVHLSFMIQRASQAPLDLTLALPEVIFPFLSPALARQLASGYSINKMAREVLHQFLLSQFVGPPVCWMLW